MFFNTVLTSDLKPLFTDTPDKIREWIGRYHEQLIQNNCSIYIAETHQVMTIKDYLYKI